MRRKMGDVVGCEEFREQKVSMAAISYRLIIDGGFSLAVTVRHIT
jgi:hypothetical protein